MCLSHFFLKNLPYLPCAAGHHGSGDRCPEFPARQRHSAAPRLRGDHQPISRGLASTLNATDMVSLCCHSSPSTFHPFGQYLDCLQQRVNEYLSSSSSSSPSSIVPSFSGCYVKGHRQRYHCQGGPAVRGAVFQVQTGESTKMGRARLVRCFPST